MTNFDRYLNMLDMRYFDNVLFANLYMLLVAFFDLLLFANFLVMMLMADQLVVIFTYLFGDVVTFNLFFMLNDFLFNSLVFDFAFDSMVMT